MKADIQLFPELKIELYLFCNKSMLSYTGIQLAELYLHITGKELCKHRKDSTKEKSQECLLNSSDVRLSGAEVKVTRTESKSGECS